jgi:hypothetical protein
MQWPTQNNILTYAIIYNFLVQSFENKIKRNYQVGSPPS